MLLEDIYSVVLFTSSDADGGLGRASWIFALPTGTPRELENNHDQNCDQNYNLESKKNKQN